MDVFMRRRLLVGGALALVVLLLAVVLADGDEEEPGPPVAQIGETTTDASALTQEDVIAQGDAICAEVETALETSNAADDAELARREAEVTSEGLAALTAIQAPDDGRAAFDDFIAAYAERVELLEQRSVATERGDTSALAMVDASLESAEQAALTAAAEYGFEDCAGAASTGGGGGGDGTGIETGTETAPGTAPVTPAPTTTPTPTPVTPVTPQPTPQAPVDPGGGASSPAPTPAPPADGGTGGTGGLGPG